MMCWHHACCRHHFASSFQALTFCGSLKTIIKKHNPTKSVERIQALLEAATADSPDGNGKDFIYSSFFAENRNGDQGEVCATRLCV
jgi:hypothetical protein